MNLSLSSDSRARLDRFAASQAIRGTVQAVATQSVRAGEWKNVLKLQVGLYRALCSALTHPPEQAQTLACTTRLNEILVRV